MTKLSAETNKITNLTGDERLPASDGVGTTPADGWIDPRDFIPDGGGIPAFTIAGVRQAQFGLTSAGAQALTANRLYLVPFFFRQRRTFLIAEMAVTTASGTAGHKGRIGFYKLNPDTGQPTTLLQELGEIPIDSTGIKQLTGLSFTPPDPGWYYGAFIPQSAVSVVGMNGAAGSGAPCGVTLGATAISPHYGVLRDVGSYAFPTDASALAFTKPLGTAFPAIFIGNT